MIYVVDQNMMRSDDLRILLEEPSNRFVVPDAAFEEMTRHERWERTLRGSFEILSGALDRTFVTAPIGELLKHERDRRSAVTHEEILPSEITDGVRRLVEAVVSGSERSDEFRRRVEACRPRVQAERPSAADQKIRLLDDVEQLTELNGPELVDEIRKDRMDETAKLGLLKLRAEAIVEQFFGFGAPTVGPSGPWPLMTTRLVAAELWYREHWLWKGGFTDVKPKTVANDAFDKEYALLASYFDALLSDDRKTRACAAALAVLADRTRAAELTDAVEAHAVATGRLPPRLDPSG